jgi:hypothetical protein
MFCGFWELQQGGNSLNLLLHLQAGRELGLLHHREGPQGEKEEGSRGTGQAVTHHLAVKDHGSPTWRLQLLHPLQQGCWLKPGNVLNHVKPVLSQYSRLGQHNYSCYRQHAVECTDRPAQAKQAGRCRLGWQKGPQLKAGHVGYCAAGAVLHLWQPHQGQDLV